MRFLGVFIIITLFAYSCKTDNTAKKPVSELVTEVSKGEKPAEKVEVADKTQVVLEEKYAELKDKEPTKETTTKPAQEPIAQPASKRVEEVKTKTEKQADIKDKVQAEIPKIIPPPTKKETQVQDTKPKTEVKPVKATTDPAMPAKLPTVIPEKQVENVPVSTSEKSRGVTKPTPAKLLHTPFSELLSAHVSPAGKVNYKGIKAQSSELDAYLSALESADLSSMSRNEKLAYWINAYNAFTIKKIIDNYPLSSITDLDGGKPWDTKWINLSGKTLSLNNIENDIIRPKYKEPRIHFAVNCAAKSCPPLMNKAWMPDNLEADFTRQTKAFVNNAQHNKLNANSCEVSKIFEWYAVDFGDLISFLNKYSSTTIDPSAKLSYKDYDWSLNQ